MLDKTIDSALLQLRAQIVREGREGLRQVEALLQLRGVPLSGVPRRIPQSIRAGTKRAILDALAVRPMCGMDVARHICLITPGLTYRRAVGRVYQALARMGESGVAVKEGQVWRLTYESKATSHPRSQPSGTG